MYAIVKTGGKQYRVEPGAELFVEKLDGQPGDTVTLPALCVVDGDNVVAKADDAGNCYDRRPNSRPQTGRLQTQEA